MRGVGGVKGLPEGETLFAETSGVGYKSGTLTLGKATVGRQTPLRLRQDRRYTEAVERGSGHLQIGEAANRAGVTQRTLRYYEELGLLKPASRMDGGFRLYSPEDMERIEYIKNLRDVLGFSLAEIGELVESEDARNQLKSGLHSTETVEQRRARLIELKQVAVRQMRIMNEKRQRLREMRAGIQSRIDRLDAMFAELEDRERDTVST